MTAITPRLLDAYTESSGPFRSVLGGQAVNESTLLSFLVFGMMQLLTSFYAVNLASSWVAEELDGRLELELACPTPRVKYFQQRLAASVMATAVVIGLAEAGMYVAGALANVDVSRGDAAVALVLLLPFTAVIVSLGYCVSSLRPQMVVGVASAAVLISYLVDLLVPLFGWPNDIRSLSVFYLYGTPLTSGVDWPSMAALLAVVTVLAVAGSILFDRRDVAR